MANFYARYPSAVGAPGTASTVQGPGTAGTQSGGVLTVQGDPAGTPIPITGTITAPNPSVSTTGAAVPASATYGGMNVGGNLTGFAGTANGLKVDASATTQPVSGTVAVTQSTSPWIVAGGGTAGTAATGVVTVQGIASGTAQPVSAASLPLPSGASTSALQSSGNVLLGQIAADTSTINSSTGNIDSKTPALGQATMVNSSPVVIASNQSAVPVSGTVAISGTVAATQSGTWTVQPGNTANTTPWLATVSQGGNSATVSAGGAMKVDASASTQPVSGTVAVTQSTSPWVVSGGGTAGTAASGVVTVQGIASMTALKVDGSAVTQPVSGTVSAAQSGTWTVQPGNTANTTAWKVDGSAVTQPVSGTVTANAGTGTFTTDQVTAAATFQDGSIAFGSLTTSFATVVTAGGSLRMVQLRNNTNALVLVSLDSGSTTAYSLDIGDQVSIDLKSNGRSIATSTTLQAKYSGAAPTSGSIRINTMY